MSLLLQSIQIKILLGHSAQWRKKPTPEGFTHDWKMVVQGEEGQEIRHFVEKVVFHLHESFPRPKRGWYNTPVLIVYINEVLFQCQYSKSLLMK